jgi:hypothetical protein
MTANSTRFENYPPHPHSYGVYIPSGYQILMRQKKQKIIYSYNI